MSGVSTDGQFSVKKASLMGYIVFFLAASFYFYEYFLQISPSVLTHDLMRDLSINAATLGTISAFYYYTYTAFQIPAGLLYDKFGARIVLTIVILICSLGALCFGLTDSITLVSVGRLLMGAGSSFAFVGTLYLILRWFPISQFAILAGVTQLMGSFGAVFGAAPLAALNNNIGWHKSIMLMAGIGVILAVVVFLVIRNQPKDSHFNNQQKHKVSMKKSLMKVFLNRQTWPVAIYSCMIWAPIAAFAGLWGVPFLVAEFNLSTVDAAQMIAAVWIGIAIGSPLIGYVSERLKRRVLPLSVVALLGLISSITIIYVPHVPQWFAYILLFGIGIAASGQSLAFAVVTDIQARSNTSAAIGFNNMAVVCGAIVFQPFIGQMLDLNWDGVAMHEGVRLYSSMDYQIALFALPVCYLICFITSVLFIKESHHSAKCK